MQRLGALLVSAGLAGLLPVAPVTAARADVAAAAGGEAYVAELDADWNVQRETRVACSPDAGCAVDLVLGHPDLAAVHVRFDAPQGGAVAVSSRIEGRDGRASAPEAETLALDRTGFGAGHYEARLANATAGGPIIMMAVKIPGWTAPAAPVARSGGEPT